MNQGELLNSAQEVMLLVEIQKGNTVQQAAEKLGFDWSTVDHSLNSLNFRAYIVQLATLAGGERVAKNKGATK